MPSRSFVSSRLRDPPDLHSFPTRRSSDLSSVNRLRMAMLPRFPGGTNSFCPKQQHRHTDTVLDFAGGDRKSTRLNSSHVASSYAVFCLKKKTSTIRQPSSHISRCLLTDSP